MLCYSCKTPGRCPLPEHIYLCSFHHPYCKACHYEPAWRIHANTPEGVKREVREKINKLNNEVTQEMLDMLTEYMIKTHCE